MILEQIRLIEELAANAWPAGVVQAVDGWRLRYNWGVTSRANSVWPNIEGRALAPTERGWLDVFCMGLMDASGWRWRGASRRTNQEALPHP